MQILFFIGILMSLVSGQECLTELLQLKNMSYVDATVSVTMIASSGLGPGNLGNWDQCQDIGSQYAQFCTMIGLIGNISTMMGVCVPASCTEIELTYGGNLFFSSFGVSVAEVYCNNEHSKPSLSAGAIFFIFLIVLLASFVLAGTVLEHYQSVSRATRPAHINATHHAGEDAHEDTPFLVEEKPKKMWETFLLCFAIKQNLSFLLNDKHSTGAFGMLNGLRVAMMFWIILGHTPYFQLETVGYDNIVHVVDIMHRFASQMFQSAEFAVDAFFYLSGFLVTYLTYEEVRNKRFSNWTYYYLHRFWRLTPAYMFFMFFSFKLLPFIGQGPFWFLYQGFVNTCDKYWWTNLLYINNLYPVNFIESCMGWSWYLANDMQFFCLVPLIIFLYRISREGFWAVIILLQMGCLLLNGIFMGYYYDSLGPSTIMNEKIYAKPYTRIAPYFLGMCAAFLVSDHKSGLSRFFSNGILRWTTYIAAFGITFACVYGTHKQQDWQKWDWTFYTALSHWGFTFGLNLFIMSCFAGYGGIITWFLSAPFWAPLSKLTYCAYLIHPLVMVTVYFEETREARYSWSQLAYQYVGNLVFSYSLALVGFLLVEKPSANLERLLRESRKKR